MIYISTSSPDRQTDILVEQYRAVYNCMLRRGKKVDSTISLRKEESTYLAKSHHYSSRDLYNVFNHRDANETVDSGVVLIPGDLRRAFVCRTCCGARRCRGKAAVEWLRHG